MSETARQQTTKGIWMAQGRTPPASILNDEDSGSTDTLTSKPTTSSPTPNGILVMDVEGTDGRERGEDQDFERKSALFSVATAQVIIVNMWENMVGLYNGANMGLLKTVFEVNLMLFHNNGESGERKTKTLLMFVIRDHISTPLENLSQTIKTDLDRIWDGLSKPKGLEESVITDFFDFMFRSLPHKKLMPEKFDEAADELRHRFTDSDNPEYVFRPNYHKRIPADGFPHYASSIWTKIVSNKDLDLPTQQELLAQYRCDEIATAAYHTFTETVQQFKNPIEAGRVIDDLGAATSAAREELMRVFDRDASRYHATVYTRKRAEVMRTANTMLNTFFLGQLKNLSKAALTKFSAQLDKDLAALTLPGNLGFIDHVKSARQTAETYFVDNAKAICLDETDWSYAEQLLQLGEEMDAISTRRRTEEMAKTVTLLHRTVGRQISEPITKHLNEPSPVMWKRVVHDYKLAYETAKELLIKKAQNEFAAGNEEILAAISQLRQKSWSMLTKKIHEETADSMMLIKLRNRFEDGFRYDEAGLPRIWTPSDNIDLIYRNARDEALKLVPLFACMDADLSDLDLETTDAFNPEEATHILTDAKQSDLTNRFRRDADATYVDAKRSIVATTSQIPYWILVVLVALGWNEFTALLYWLWNPVNLFIFMILSAGVSTVFFLNLQGPAFQLFTMIVSQATKMITERIREAQEHATRLELPHRARTDESHEMTDRNESSRASSAKAKARTGSRLGRAAITEDTFSPIREDGDVEEDGDELNDRDLGSDAADGSGRRRRAYVSQPSSGVLLD